MKRILCGVFIVFGMAGVYGKNVAPKTEWRSEKFAAS